MIFQNVKKAWTEAAMRTASNIHGRRLETSLDPPLNFMMNMIYRCYDRSSKQKLHFAAILQDDTGADKKSRR